MNDPNSAKARVRETIEGLYSAFSAYRLRPHVDGCPCCVTDEHQRQIRSRDLRFLEAKELEEFARKAMTTWGTPEDFKHFLPRLFEIQTFAPDWLVDSEVLFGKLEYASWRSWPIREQEAIENFLISFWAFALSRKSDFGNIEANLCSIAQCEKEVSLYLRFWLENLSELAIWHLADLVYDNNHSILTKVKLKNAFWETREEQMKQVIKWLLNPSTAKAFKGALKRDATEDDSREIQSAFLFFDNQLATGGVAK